MGGRGGVNRASAVYRVLAGIGLLVPCLLLLAHVLGIDSPWLALLAMCFLLALAKLAEPLWMPSLPRALADVQGVLDSETGYRRLGVHAFGTLLRRSPLRLLNTAVYLPHGPGDLARLARLAESAEAAHFWAALLFTPYIGYAFWRGWWRAGLVLLAVQLVLNLYPMLHLRLVRARLARVMDRRASRN